MKRILLIFIVLVASYLLFTNISRAVIGTKEKSVAVDPSTQNITIDVAGVSTEIIPENRNNVSAELHGKGTVRLTHIGDTIRISYKRGWLTGDWFTFFDNTKLKISIPKSYNRDLHLAIGSGNVNFKPHSPMKLDTLTVDVGSGNINLQNLQTNHYKHLVASGNTEIDTLTAKDGVFHISSGNVHLTHYTGKMTADLASGIFRAQLDHLSDNVKVNVASGIVQLDLPKKSDFTLKGSIVSGRINNNFALNDSKQDSKTIEGTYGTGKYLVDLHAISGLIKVY